MKTHESIVLKNDESVSVHYLINIDVIEVKQYVLEEEACTAPVPCDPQRRQIQ